MKTLLVVESPNKSGTIKKYIGPDYLIRATVGHIADLAPIGKYVFGVDIEGGFKPKYKMLADKKDKIRAIVDAAKQCDRVLIATDKDREGEIIAYETPDGGGHFMGAAIPDLMAEDPSQAPPTRDVIGTLRWRSQSS